MLATTWLWGWRGQKAPRAAVRLGYDVPLLVAIVARGRRLVTDGAYEEQSDGELGFHEVVRLRLRRASKGREAPTTPPVANHVLPCNAPGPVMPSTRSKTDVVDILAT
jgi:hypothetical protein